MTLQNAFADLVTEQTALEIRDVLLALLGSTKSLNVLEMARNEYGELRLDRNSLINNLNNVYNLDNTRAIGIVPQGFNQLAHASNIANLVSA